MSIDGTGFLEKARECLKEHRADPATGKRWMTLPALSTWPSQRRAVHRLTKYSRLPSASKAIRLRFASRSATHPAKSREGWPNSRFPSRVAPTSRASTPTFSPDSQLPLRFNPNGNPRHAQRLRHGHYRAPALAFIDGFGGCIRCTVIEIIELGEGSQS